MSNYIKDAAAELEHVVWPTHIETKNFLKAVLGIIIGMTIFTYLITILFSNGMFAIREAIHGVENADISASPTVSGEPIQINNTQPIEIKTEDGKTINVTPEVTTE